MTQRLVIANLKMNGDLAFLEALASSLPTGNAAAVWQVDTAHEFVHGRMYKARLL